MVSVTVSFPLEGFHTGRWLPPFGAPLQEGGQCHVVVRWDPFRSGVRTQRRHCGWELGWVMGPTSPGGAPRRPGWSLQGVRPLALRPDVDLRTVGVGEGTGWVERGGLPVAVAAMPFVLRCRQYHLVGTSRLDDDEGARRRGRSEV